MPRPLILDGAMGTMIQNAGLRLGEKPEIFALKNSQAVLDIQKEYVKAHSDVLYSNTFGANRHKLAGTGHEVSQVIRTNVEIAKEAAAGKAKVALDIGPIGELMAPLGTLSFDEAYDIFKEMVVSGRDAGADLVVFETFTDLYEVKAAVLAAKENSNLPVWVTMSFEQDGCTFTGTTVECMATVLDSLGVDAMGINCSLGPKEILPLMRTMAECTQKPLIAKPNAGLPDPATGTYFITPKEFASQMEGYLELGIMAMGGCCGTTPAFIKAISDMLDTSSSKVRKPETKATGCVCSQSKLVSFDKLNVIGERINPTGKKRLKEALSSHDMNHIMQLAISQADAGATILDINVGVPGLDEVALMKEVVQAVQGVVNLPLMIDSSNAKAIEAGLRYANGKAIVNSVNANDDKLKEILPIASKYGAAVVGLTMDKGLPSSVEQRIEFAKKIRDRAKAAGIRECDIIIDCLTLTVSAQQDQAQKTLDAVRKVRHELGLHTTLGVSNIAFGLPEKTHVTESFLTLALGAGLDLPIVNPNNQIIMDAIASFRALSGEDRDCKTYIERFARPTEQKETKISEGMDIQTAILKGLGKETEKATEKLLKAMEPMDVINEKLIPALDLVGDKYERHEIFLPQLINAANAAGCGFDIIKKRLPKKSGSSKGKIIIATVEGDIHDIGKNIVKVVLENYGYDVIDLGKDVPVQTVVERTIAEDAHLVALSALMTTTVESMKRTIEALRQSGHVCKVMVGGAVLTAEYAELIGADYYTKDPKQSADTAREVLG